MDSILHYFPGAIAYGFWLLMEMKLSTWKLHWNIACIVLSLAMSVFYLMNKKTRQLVYSTRAVLGSSPHIHERCASSSIRRVLATKLMKMAGRTVENGGDRMRIIEIDVWNNNPWVRSFFIFLSPFTTFFGLYAKSSVDVLIFTPGIAFAMLVLTYHYDTAILDQKILGEELYRTAQDTINVMTCKYSNIDYSARYNMRKKVYGETAPPRYGPGIDLKREFDDMQFSSDGE